MIHTYKGRGNYKPKVLFFAISLLFFPPLWCCWLSWLMPVLHLSGLQSYHWSGSPVYWHVLVDKRDSSARAHSRQRTNLLLQGEPAPHINHRPKLFADWKIFRSKVVTATCWASRTTIHFTLQVIPMEDMAGRLNLKEVTIVFNLICTGLFLVISLQLS